MKRMDKRFGWRIAVAVTLLLFVAGCGKPDLSDSETVERIAAKALPFERLQDRGDLVYEPNRSEPYSGWTVEYYSSDPSQVLALSRFDDGLIQQWALWHSNGQMMSHRHYVDEDRLHVTEWYENGQMKSRGEKARGDMMGEWTWWYENGQMEKRHDYVDGPAQVAVVVQLEDVEGAPTRLDDIEVRLLPYDRDAIFDSLTALAPNPRPEPTEEQRAARDARNQAQDEWLGAQDRWNTLRDTVKKLVDELAELNPAMNTYRRIHAEYTRMERELARVNRMQWPLFERFDSLDRALRAEAQVLEARLDEWGDEAFRDLWSVINAKVEASGLAEFADTTGTKADGVALFHQHQVPPGAYWVHARRRRTHDELYWNVMATVARGENEAVVLVLDESNAEVREIF